jgi:carbonic anhydrase
MINIHNPIHRLLAGFRSFRAAYYEQRPERIRNLIESGQKPEVLLIACSDSRVDPAILTNSEPGDLFVVRNVANLVPPYMPDGSYHGTSAAVEFAIRDLCVSHVVILGHSQCGGVRALMGAASSDSGTREFITPWVSIARCACESVPQADDGKFSEASQVEQASVRCSINNLMTFPWIREKVLAEELTLHGWWFDIVTGVLWGLNIDTGEFEPLVRGEEITR